MTTIDKELLSKEDYYKDSRFISFSGLKVFSKCETLYRDLFVTKTYEEPERDYFVYGKLVDALVTESPEFIEENFIRVDRKINPEDALKFENQIKELKAEIEKKEIELREKPNKTTEKGIASRREKILSIQASLDAIKDLADKQQVTPSVWENAESTALALKTHPYYSSMEFNDVTSQQIFTCVRRGIPCKGKLDHLKLSPSITKFYAIYKAGQMTLPQLQFKINNEVHDSDKWAIITDVKTCYSMEKIEPYNTHYRGQLGFYQDLVHEVLGIPTDRIKCQALVADKATNEFKMSELFIYDQKALDEIKGDVWSWMELWQKAMIENKFVSAKAKDGMKQKCFTCSDCRFCPFSMQPGTPVLVSGPRFTSQQESVEVSTADAVLDY